MTNIRYPFGAPDSAALSATGAQAITITGGYTVIDGVSTPASGNRTLNLTVDAELQAGARLSVKLKSASTETTTFGTAIDGPVITGVAGKTFCQSFTYDGGSFLPDGTAVQID
jgi:hypothetical protein